MLANSLTPLVCHVRIIVHIVIRMRLDQFCHEPFSCKILQRLRTQLYLKSSHLSKYPDFETREIQRPLGPREQYDIKFRLWKSSLWKKTRFNSGWFIVQRVFYCIGKLNQSCVKVKFSACYIDLTFSNIHVIVARGNQFVSITNYREF